MVVCESSINNIMGGIENTGGVTLHNHRRKLKQRFDIIKKLGQGTYGKVQLGINKETGQEVAIKTIKKCKIETEADLIRIRREIQIMSSVQHPNIIHIYEVFENREKMVLVMEYAAGGELYDYLSERKVLTEDEARRIFRQIATAVYYCHKHKICHRDLKLENILLDEHGSAKIADFGLSNVFDERRLLSTFCGSPLYASPEIVKGTPYHGPEVDCWSLGVLLYTLVYGAMPFDGSNFKRLVKQISQGDYFEPKKPSSASPLIREMLTVMPDKRGDIEKICSHWWVNANYTESCLEIAEELANQTPVRLDLLLSLAPPPPQVGSDKLMIAGESSSMTAPIPESSAPVRSQSVGSLMELVPPAERRIRDLVTDDKQSPKRKLEVTVSTENANLSNSGAKRKERVHKDVESSVENGANETETMEPIPSEILQNADTPLTKNLTQTLVKETEPITEAAEANEAVTDPALEGAACKELIEESKKKKIVKVKKSKTDKPALAENNVKEGDKANDKENQSNNIVDPEGEKEETKIPVKRKIVKKKVVSAKSTDKPVEEIKSDAKTEAVEKSELKQEAPIAEAASDKQKEEEAQPPTKPVERRRSKIFETAEKFQNLLANNESKTSVIEKPKKIFIPGVNVGGFKKEFERKASLTSAADIKKVFSKKSVPTNSNQVSPTDEIPSEATTNKPEEVQSAKTDVAAPIEIVPNSETVQQEEMKTPEAVSSVSEEPATTVVKEDEEQKQRLKNAVSVISNAITKDGARKSKSRPCIIRKPPVPFGINGRSASGSIGMGPAQFSPMYAKSANLESTSEINKLESPEEDKKSSCEITLKSATLPRRKTTKAEIQLDYPPPKPATMEFKTEIAHRIEKAPELKTQRSEIIVPVNNNANIRLRSTSLDPEVKAKESPKERIIPISFEKESNNEVKPEVTSPQAKPPMPKPFQSQRSVPQRFGSFSRQSTHESDSEATISENLEPIRKSPREYIIPIAVEGGGYVTPRATSLEPPENSSGVTSSSTGRRSIPKFGRPKKMGFLDRDGSEDELSFSSLHRHNSIGRDSDNEDSRREPFHMHRLRSSRPTRKANLEHADSLSSGEEDDDDGFEILTAENLFSTLLSRVRSLTQRLNVEDNGRLGFPSSRLHFDHGSKLWNNLYHNDPLSRFSPMERTFSRQQSNNSSSTSDRSAPWRRSVSRDLAADIERVFSEGPTATTTTTATATLPRDKSKKQKDINLSNLDFSKIKLSDEDALALSYLTPGLSRRIQNQLFSQLPTARSRKLSHNNSNNDESVEHGFRNSRKSVDRVLSDSSDSEAFTERLRRNEKLNNDLHDLGTLSESSTAQNSVSESDNQNPKSDKYDYNSYKPYRHCYRSTSLLEPKSDTYRNPLYFRKGNYSSESFDPTYNKESYVPNNTQPSTNLNYSNSTSRPYLSNVRGFDCLSHQDASPEAPPTRRVSRFLRPDFYDNCVYTKERQKRELETQKVLKEIRNKRINESKEKLNSCDNYKTNNDDKSDVKSVDEVMKVKYEAQNEQVAAKNNVLLPVSNLIPKIEDEQKCNNVEEKKIKRDSKMSKLIRPKSYPAESSDIKKSNIETNSSNTANASDKNTKTKLFKRSPSSEKSKDSNLKESQSAEATKSGNNQFLNSIEKKIRSFYSEKEKDDSKAKNETKSRIQKTIRSLREQSEPRNIDTCVTESGLIKRAVSVEDFSVFGTNRRSSLDSKTLQASKKSVTKILGLFKRYEDKEKSTPKKKSVKSTESGVKKSSDSAKNDDTNKNIRRKSSAEVKSLSKSVAPINRNGVDNGDQHCNVLQNAETNSNTEDNAKYLKKYYPRTNVSKLPVQNSRNSLELESKVEPTRKSSIPINDNAQYLFSRPSQETKYKPERKNLKLELKTVLTDSKTKTRNDIPTDENSSKDENSILFSPCDESNDSWSVCSDNHRQDMSPTSDNRIFSEEEGNESVSDRIRRKSFYCRFNEKKKPRRSTLVGSSFDYKDYDMKYGDKPISNSVKSRKLPDYGNDSSILNKSFSNSSTLQYPDKKNVKTYNRTYSMNDNFYAYNPKRYSDSAADMDSCSSLRLLESKAKSGESKSSSTKQRRTSLQSSPRVSDRFSMSPTPNSTSSADTTM